MCINEDTPSSSLCFKNCSAVTWGELKNHEGWTLTRQSLTWWNWAFSSKQYYLSHHLFTSYFIPSRVFIKYSHSLRISSSMFLPSSPPCPASPISTPTSLPTQLCYLFFNPSHLVFAAWILLHMEPSNVVDLPGPNHHNTWLPNPQQPSVARIGLCPPPPPCQDSLL